MSEVATQLIATFDALSSREQQVVLAALLKRCGELPGQSLADDELVGLADEVFQALDREEANGAAAESR